jgi:hypothetical protein
LRQIENAFYTFPKEFTTSRPPKEIVIEQYQPLTPLVIQSLAAFIKFTK